MVNVTPGGAAWLTGHTDAQTPSLFPCLSSLLRASVSSYPFTSEKGYRLVSTAMHWALPRKICLLFLATQKRTSD